MREVAYLSLIFTVYPTWCWAGAVPQSFDYEGMDSDILKPTYLQNLVSPWFSAT